MTSMMPDAYAKIAKMHDENVKVVIGRRQHVTFLPEPRRNKGEHKEAGFTYLSKRKR